MTALANSRNHHTNWVRRSGVSESSAVCHSHAILCEFLQLFISYDQVDVSNLAGVEQIVRRIIQDERAVPKNPKHPDYSGLEYVLNRTTDVSGAASTAIFNRWYAQTQRDEAAVLKSALSTRAPRRPAVPLICATVKRRPAETVSTHSRACLTRALGSPLPVHWRKLRWFSLLTVLLRNAVDEHGTHRCPGSWKTQCTRLRVRGHLYDTPDFERGMFERNCVTSVRFLTQNSYRLSGRRPVISQTKTSSLSLPAVSVAWKSCSSCFHPQEFVRQCHASSQRSGGAVCVDYDTEIKSTADVDQEKDMRAPRRQHRHYWRRTFLVARKYCSSHFHTRIPRHLFPQRHEV